MPASVDTAIRAQRAVCAVQRLIAGQDQHLRRLADELRRMASVIGQELAGRQATDAVAAELEAAGIEVRAALERACAEAGMAIGHLDDVLAVIIELRVQE